MFRSWIRKKGGKVSFKSKNRRSNTINSNFNSSETNHLKKSNTYDVIVNSKLPIINVQIKISSNKLVTLQTETDTDPSTSINDEITDDNNTSEEISYHQNSSEVIDHTYDENGINFLNTEEEAGFTSIHYINTTTGISMNDYENYP